MGSKPRSYCAPKQLIPPLVYQGYVAILFPVDHHLGDSRKSARGVGASRLFCFTAGFSGSPNGMLSRATGRASNHVNKPADKELSVVTPVDSGFELGRTFAQVLADPGNEYRDGYSFLIAFE